MEVRPLPYQYFKIMKCSNPISLFDARCYCPKHEAERQRVEEQLRILGEAWRNMSPEKQREIIDKALSDADEKLKDSPFFNRKVF